MRHSGWTLTTVLGVPIRAHWTLVVMVLGAVGWTTALYGPWMSAQVMAGLGALFGSVLLHEFAHVLVAGRYGVKTTHILLSTVGGAARMEMRRVPPRVDMVVSLAGPLMSLALGAGLWALSVLGPQAGDWLTGLASLNLALGVFNLLPIFPLDGGRVLRAALVPRLGLTRAHAVALGVGYLGIGVTLVSGWVMREPVLVVLGLAVVVLQERERRMLIAWREASGA